MVGAISLMLLKSLIFCVHPEAAVTKSGRGRGTRGRGDLGHKDAGTWDVGTWRREDSETRGDSRT